MSGPTMREILARTAADYGMSVAELTSGDRKRRVSHARQDACWRMRQIMLPEGVTKYGYGHRYSFPQIAAAVGLTDHTSVVHAVRQHQARLDAKRSADLAAWERLGT